MASIFISFDGVNNKNRLVDWRFFSQRKADREDRTKSRRSCSS